MDKRKLLEDALRLGDKPYYEDFNVSLYQEQLKNDFQPGSMPADGLYEMWMEKYRPNLVVEVGSFLGYSAIKMAKHVKKLGLPTKIICVDTWLGSPEHYRMYKEGVDFRLGYNHGYPTLYYKFITSVIQNDVQDVIQPMPYPSTIAFKILAGIFEKLDAYPEFIFLDGSHEENDVYLDLAYYYKLLKSGGVVWGDDYEWEGVNKDVNRFCQERNLVLNILENKVHWFIEKK